MEIFYQNPFQKFPFLPLLAAGFLLHDSPPCVADPPFVEFLFAGTGPGNRTNVLFQIPERIVHEWLTKRNCGSVECTRYVAGIRFFTIKKSGISTFFRNILEIPDIFYHCKMDKMTFLFPKFFHFSCCRCRGIPFGFRQFRFFRKRPVGFLKIFRPRISARTENSPFFPYPSPDFSKQKNRILCPTGFSRFFTSLSSYSSLPLGFSTPGEQFSGY